MSMQCLLPIAVALLLAGQATSAARVRRLLTVIDPTNNQHVQFTVAIKDQTCADLKDTSRPGADFSAVFMVNMRSDVTQLLTNQGQSQAVPTVVGYNGGCADMPVSCLLMDPSAPCAIPVMRSTTCHVQLSGPSVIHQLVECAA